MHHNSEWINPDNLRAEKIEADASRRKHISKQVIWFVVLLVVFLVAILFLRGTLPHRDGVEDPALIKRGK